MTKLFWFWCQHNHVRGSEAEENASESHLKKEILQLFVHRAADEEEAEVRQRQPSSIFQPGASLVAARSRYPMAQEWQGEKGADKTQINLGPALGSSWVGFSGTLMGNGSLLTEVSIPASCPCCSQALSTCRRRQPAPTAASLILLPLTRLFVALGIVSPTLIVPLLHPRTGTGAQGTCGACGQPWALA